MNWNFEVFISGVTALIVKFKIMNIVEILYSVGFPRLFTYIKDIEVQDFERT